MTTSDSVSSAAPERRSLRHVAAEGLAVLALQSVGARVLMFAGQFALGWLLSPTDFGVGALAATITTVAWSIMGFGADEVLQQRGRTLYLWERTIFFVSLGQGVLGLGFLIASGPFFARAFHVPEMPALLTIAGVSMLIASLVVVSSAKIYAALDFKWIAGFNTFDVFASQILTLGFAAAGCGAYALFFPGPILLLAKAILFWRRQPPRLDGRLHIRRSRAILSRGSHVLGARLLNSAISQGDYLVLGLAASAPIVGFYAFAFRLAAVPVRIIANNLQSVLLPALAKLRSDPARQNAVAFSAAEILSYIVTFLCFVQAALAPETLKLFFGDKWQDSVVLIQILSLGLPAEALGAVARARLSASGAFAVTFRYTLASAAGFFLFVAVGAWTAQAIGVAIAVTAYYLLVQPVVFFRAFRPPEGVLVAAIRIYLRPMLVAGASVGAAAAATTSLSGLPALLALGAGASVAQVLLLRLTAPGVFSELTRLALQITGRGTIKA